MSDLNSLMIFAKVVEANSFSKAARRLKMPTSTVSRRIADLEGQLGVRLLERSTRSLRLTDVGSQVLEYAQHSAELSETVDNIASTICRMSQVYYGFRRHPASPTRCLRPWSAHSRQPTPRSAYRSSLPNGSWILSPRE